MQYVRKRKRFIKNILIASSLLCCLLLLVLIINIDKFYAKFVYRGSLEGRVVIPSRSSGHSFAPSPNMILPSSQTLEFSVTYNANGGYYNNDSEKTTNIIKYKDNKIEEGRYIIPKYPTASFRKWYTTETFEEGTEFDINNYNGPDITVYAYSEEKRATINLGELTSLLNEGTYNEKSYSEQITAIIQESSFPSFLPEDWINSEPSAYKTDEYHLIYIETHDDNLPIVFWFTCQDQQLHWYSEDPNPIIKSSSDGLKGFVSITNISGLENWDTKELNQMNNFFANCSSLADISPIRYWNVTNVTSMNSTFSEMTSLTTPEIISYWNIINVTDFTKMFYNTDAKPTLYLVAGEFDSEGTYVPYGD